MDKNWSINETKQLFSLVYNAASEGKGLSGAFNEMAKSSGKSVNSIRNYYYSQLKLFEMMPAFSAQLGIKTVALRRESFTVFSNKEIDELIETVLKGKAEGKSVRAVIAQMAGGDKKTALRLQNKYRSMITCHRDRVKEVTDRMRKERKPYYDPYLKRVVKDGAEEDNVSRLAEYISKLDNDQMVDVVKLLLQK